MPCYEPPGAYGEPTVESLGKLNSDKARMLCEVLGKLEKHDPVFLGSLSSETLTWWAEHKQADARVPA